MRFFNFKYLKAGLGTRLLCFLGDLALGYYLYFYLINFDQFNLWQSSLGKLLESTFLSKCLLIFFSTQIIRFQSTLLFSLSPAQLAGGIKAVSDSFVWKRIGGASRVILETTLLMLPFDLMSFYRVTTLKEKLTNVELVERKSFFFKATQSIFLILLLFSIQLSPIIHSKDLYSFIIFKNHQESHKTSLEIPFFYSEKYHFFSYHPYSTYEKTQFFFPSLEFASNQGRLKALPHIVGYSKKDNNFWSWKLRHKLNLSELFSDVDPELSYDQQQEVLKDAFQIKDNFFHFKIYPQAYLSLRRKILSLLSSSKGVEIDFLKINKQSFLRLKQNYPHEIVETLLSLGDKEAYLFEFSWQNEETRKSVYQSFLRFLSWSSGSNQLSPREEQLNTFHIIDFLKNDRMSSEDLKKMEDFLLSLYNQSSIYAYKNESSLLKEFLVLNMSAFIGSFSQLSSLKDWEFSERFKLQVRENHKRLVLDDKNFFQVEEDRP